MIKILFFILFSLFSFSCLATTPKTFGISFDQVVGLQPSEIKQALEGYDWKILHSLYQQHVEVTQWSDKPRIPKIIHHIWLGSPLPEKYKLLRETWKKHHPGWTFMLWTDKEVENFVLANKHLYDETDNYGVKSDIARYEILYRLGGLYVDTDFECFRSFDLFHHCYHFYAGAAARESVVIYNGLIGAAPGHPIMKFCIDNLASNEGKKESVQEIDNRTGPCFFTVCFFSNILKCCGPLVIFPANYFYPWPHYVRDQNSREEILAWVRPETFAVHHWHVSWLKKPVLSSEAYRRGPE